MNLPMLFAQKPGRPRVFGSLRRWIRRGGSSSSSRRGSGMPCVLNVSELLFQLANSFRKSRLSGSRGGLSNGRGGKEARRPVRGRRRARSGASKRARERHADHIILVGTAAVDAVAEAPEAIARLDAVVGHICAVGSTAGAYAVLARHFAVAADFWGRPVSTRAADRQTDNQKTYLCGGDRRCRPAAVFGGVSRGSPGQRRRRHWIRRRPSLPAGDDGLFSPFFPLFSLFFFFFLFRTRWIAVGTKESGHVDEKRPSQAPAINSPKKPGPRWITQQIVRRLRCLLTK